MYHSIFYTGIGSHPSGRHSPDDFVQRMRQHFRSSGGPYRADQLEFENAVLPRDFDTFTLDQWMRFAGATWVTRNSWWPCFSCA